MYRLTRTTTRRWWARWWVATTAVWFVGCATTPEPPEDLSVAGKSDAELLYEAIVRSFEERGLVIEHKSMKFRVVTSEYRPVSDRLRRRFTARIVPLPGGANALRVEAQHQRRHGGDDEPVWKDVDSDALNERAASDELDLGRAIERRYRRWKEYADEQHDEGDEASEPAERRGGAETDSGARSPESSGGQQRTDEESGDRERER